jgi:hypothetical protein
MSSNRAKTVAAKLHRNVRTKRKELSSKGLRHSTLDIKAMVLGVYDEAYAKLNRTERHFKVASTLSFLLNK